MREITPDNAVAYLRDVGQLDPSQPARASALGWGVSNIVIRIDAEGREPVILKQSRERLRVATEWISRIDRIWTEVAALRLLGEALDPGVVPKVLFEDRDNYAFLMTSAPEGCRVWKEMLLEGDRDADLARRAGFLLGTIHERLAGHPALSQAPFVDREVFGQLRIDPFYRTLSKAHPLLKPGIDDLIESMGICQEITFVHADFSPKNLLIAPDRSMTLVDFETAHAGDPAFDVGFFLSHLILKQFKTEATGEANVPPGTSLVSAAYAGYRQVRPSLSPEFHLRHVQHMAACALARVDGKSPVDYLDDLARNRVRRFAYDLLRTGSLFDD